MNEKITILFSFLCFAISLTYGDEISSNQKESIPVIQSEKAVHVSLESAYVFSDRLNPFYLRGDFNGDGLQDVASLIEEVKTKRYGIAIFHSKEKNVIYIGAGNEFGNGGLDFVWMDIWRVSEIKSIPSKIKKQKPLIIKGEAIHVEKKDIAKALIYWDGETYKWHQLH